MKKITVFAIFLFTSVWMLLFAGQAMADVQGIDVSKWQGTIDWDTAYNHASFAIIKAGGSDEGMYTDGQFTRNRDEARRVGIARGYYYYAGGGDPMQEAEHFASLVSDLQPGEILALDFEVDHPDPVAYAWTFLVRTEQLTGSKPLFYTNMNRVWSYDWRPVAENGNHLWGAIYDGDPGVFPDPGYWPALAIKQFTSDAVIPGIGSASVDMNVFPSVVEDFKAMGLPKPALPVVEKIEPVTPEPVLPEPVVAESQDTGWDAYVQLDEGVDPKRVVGIVPLGGQVEGGVSTLTIHWPSRPPATIETSHEMDFAVALDS